MSATVVGLTRYATLRGVIVTDSPGNGYLVNSGYKSTGPSTNSLETWRSNTSNQYQAGAPKQPNVGDSRPDAFDAGAAGQWEFPHSTPTGASTGAAQGNSAMDQNLTDSQDAAASAARSGLDSVRQFSRLEVNDPTPTRQGPVGQGQDPLWLQDHQGN